MKIHILDAATLGDDLDLSPLGECGEVQIWPSTPPELVTERMSGADVVVVNKIKIHQGNLPVGDACPKLICLCATGYDNVNLTDCRTRGIGVANVVGYSSDSVAQVTVGLVLSLLCHLPAYLQNTASGDYTSGGCANCLTPTYHEIAGMTWGVVGAGRIGQRVAEVAKALGCRVLTCRRTPDENSVDLDTLLKSSDIVTLHTPLTPETRGMIDQHALSQMKRGSILVNMARGAVTNESALADAILTGHLGGLGADVFSVEPFGEDHPFNRIKHLPNVALTPHMSWGAFEARVRCLSEVVKNIQAFEKGERRCRVD